MAETKPTKIPRWADTGVRVEPGESKKDDGWVAPEKPPDTFFNWLQGISGDWFKWINERIFDPTAGVATADEDSLQLGDPAQDAAGNASITKLLIEGVLTADKVAAETVTAFPGAEVIRAAAALWQTASVAVNDIAVVAGTPADDGVYLIKGIPAETDLELRNLDGSVPTLAGGAPAGTVTVKSPAKMVAVATDGLHLRQRIGGDAWKMKAPSDAFGGDKDWIFPATLPSAAKSLTIDAAGQLAFEDIKFGVTIGPAGSGSDFEGSDETPFDNAIATLTSGGIIFVKRGTYTFTSQVDISNNGIRIIGEGRSVVLITSSLATTATFLVSADDVELQDLHIQQTNATDNENYCVRVTGSRFKAIFNHVEHTFAGTTLTNGYRLIQIENTSDHQILFNDLELESIDSDAGRRAINVESIAGGSPSLVENIRIMGNLFIVNLNASPSQFDSNALIHFDCVASATEGAKIYRCVIAGNAQQSDESVAGQHGFYGTYWRATNNAGGGVGDIARIMGCAVSGNTWNSMKVTHDTQNGSAEDPVIEGNSFLGNIDTGNSATAFLRLGTGGATIPGLGDNSVQLAGNFVAPTSGAGATVEITDNLLQQDTNILAL